MRIIMKFGGSSVGSGSVIKKTAEIIASYRPKECVVVVSAMQGVTDTLLNVSQKVVGMSEKKINDFTIMLNESHKDAAFLAVSPQYQKKVIEEIKKLCSELQKVLIGVSYVGEITPRSKDYIVSFGERLSAPILSGALNSIGARSEWLTGYEAGIITDSEFGNAKPRWDKINEMVRNSLEPFLRKGKVPVVTGFIGADEKGRITTLGRGGSDYTAAILGAALNADEIWIWSDVNGILTSDPRLIEEARTIDVISYIEAMELAYFGAKILHPKTIEPAMEKNIPVRVRNTFNPGNKGTLILKEQKKTGDVVKAISIMENVALLTVSGAGMIGVPGVAARVFGALAQEKINILMISQGSSEVNISVVIEKKDLQKAVDTLEKTFSGKDVVKDLNYSDKVAIIAVVGAGMKGTKGVAARIFRAVADAGVNVLMIAQGSSEVNISFVVLQEDAKKAAKALHNEFIKA
jgi:aspartate kinase